MRFSAMQDSGCEVALPQDQFSDNMDELMMATAENVEPKSSTMEPGPLTSNLPLLFANGYPTSLEKITLNQLERFITFMVQCSLGHEAPNEISKPQWWPKEVTFSNPLTRPKTVTEAWMANLKKLVFRCYTYHRSEYLLRFCSCLAQYPHEELEYVDHWDTTTSLYHKSTGKLLVTFRNENVNYDKRNESPRKKLLSHNGTASTSNKAKQQLSSLIIVEPPIEDIYLCDNCDGEFTGLKKMKEHERICCEQEAGSSVEGSSNSRPNTPEVSTSQPELQQNEFLKYFSLGSSTQEAKSIEPDTSTLSATGIVRRTSRRLRGSISFVRCPTIPFSSPAGMMLAKKSKAVMTEDTLQERLERVERHLIAPLLSDENRLKWTGLENERDKWTVTYKPNRDKPPDDYTHEYRFVNAVKRKPTLSLKSQLLYILCRPVYVLLTRLTEEQLEELKREPSKYCCPIQKVSAARQEFPDRTEMKAHTHVSTKRKASEDDSESIAEKSGNISARLSAGALTDHQVGQRKLNEPSAKTMKETSAGFPPSKTITVIDLCSSDEEEDQRTSAASDENRDPLNSSDTDYKKSLVRKHTPTKFYTTPCIYPTDSGNDWLSGSVLNEDRESCANRYRSSVTLSTCAHIPPILRPAP